MQPHLYELPPPAVEPHRLRTREQAAGGDVERDLGQHPGTARVACLQRRVGALHMRDGCLDVDPDRLGELEHQLVTADQDLVPEH